MRRDRFLIQILMPTLGAALLFVLVAWPFLYPRDLVAGITDLIQLDAPEHLEMKNALLAGQDADGRRFELFANSMLQISSDAPTVTFGRAKLTVYGDDDARFEVSTQTGGEFDRRGRMLTLTGRVALGDGQGLSFQASSVEIDVVRKVIRGYGDIEGEFNGSQFQSQEILVEDWGQIVRITN